MSAIDMDNEFDEREYRNRLHRGDKESIVAAYSAFSIFGKRANLSELWTFLLSSLDFTTERSCSPLRMLHSYLHSQLLSERSKVLPFLHSVALSSFVKRRDKEIRLPSSLTSSQLQFEFLISVDREEWSRARTTGEQLFQREGREVFFSVLRNAVLRRDPVLSYSYPVLSSLYCISSAVDETPQGIASAAVDSISSTTLSEDCVLIRESRARESIDFGRLAENDFEPDEQEDERLSEAVRSGIREIALRVAIQQLRKGISPAHMLGVVASEVCRMSFQSNASPPGVFSCESAAAMLEMNNSLSPSAETVTELLHLCAAASAIPVIQQRRIKANATADECLARIHNGDASLFAQLVSQTSSSQALNELATRLAAACFTCDPLSAEDTAGAHALLILTYIPSFKNALMEAAEVYASQRRRVHSCSEFISKLVKGSSKELIS